MVEMYVGIWICRSALVSVNDLNSGRVSYAPLAESANHVLQKFEKRDPGDQEKKNSQRKEAGDYLFRHVFHPLRLDSSQVRIVDFAEQPGGGLLIERRAAQRPRGTLGDSSEHRLLNFDEAAHYSLSLLKMRWR
jgi:hypothetical protein